MKEPQRIACFHLNQVGDLLFSLPALYNLRAHFPQARITSVARPICGELLSLSGLVDEFIERPRGQIGTGIKLAGSLRSGNYDLAVLFSCSLGMRVLAFLSGSPIRVGFAHSLTARLLTRRIPWSPPPSTQNNLRLLEAIGCPVTKKDYVGLIHPSEPSRNEAELVLRSTGIRANEGFAVLGPGTSDRREIKSWSDEGFAHVADVLASRFGLKSVIVGVNNGHRIGSLSENAIDLTGKTSLSVLSAVLERAKLFVGVDSGAMHLAAAVATPVVGLFGPSDPRITGPQGEGHRVVYADLPCRPCIQSACSIGIPCMREIAPDMVLSEITALLRCSDG